MRLENSVAVIKYLIASILVGVILGIGGAFAAQGFRSGIVIISNYSEKLFGQDPNFFFYLITLSVALFLVHYSRSLVNGKPFQSVADSKNHMLFFLLVALPEIVALPPIILELLEPQP